MPKGIAPAMNEWNTYGRKKGSESWMMMMMKEQWTMHESLIRQKPNNNAHTIVRVAFQCYVFLMEHMLIIPGNGIIHRISPASVPFNPTNKQPAGPFSFICHRKSQCHLYIYAWTSAYKTLLLFGIQAITLSFTLFDFPKYAFEAAKGLTIICPSIRSFGFFHINFLPFLLF